MKKLLILSLGTIPVLALAAGMAPEPQATPAAPTHQHHPGMDMRTMQPDPAANDTSHDMPMDPAMHHAAPGMEMAGHQGMHDMHEMKGMLGAYPMTREASGTSWQPDSSKHEGIHQMLGDWSLMIHGYANVIYDRQSGPRGDTKTFSQSMLMVMGQRSLGPGTLGVRGMFSLDPLMGKSGYPELFQTGESANGVTPLIDRQHPHDLAMEMAATYSIPLSPDSSAFAYVGLPGEPALGPVAFMHRFSGIDNPEAPITHHWLDSTHISYGVTTLGYTYRNLKLEASAFHGREPDQFRYNIDTGKLDSQSARLTYNPNPNWSGQISYGRIKSPEQLEPDVNVRRTTASVTNNTPIGDKAWQTTFAWGRNNPNHGQVTNGYLLESAVTVGQSHTFFGRAERVDKNELFLAGSPLAGQSFKVNKASLGYVYDLPTEGHYRIGIGGVVSTYAIPSELNATYGKNPNSAMLFVRIKIQ